MRMPKRGKLKPPAVHAHADEYVRDFSARRAKEGLNERLIEQ
ncbi:MAG: hypothetical protein KIH69_007595 [Anaerolineae bacterium]|nr:hypothetical protein [Anaerolineae bacterium]